MALPASGPINMSHIRGEFGGTAPDNLSEYYRGGPYVPNTPTNSAIPTAGAIKMSNFYGTAAGPADHATTITVGFLDDIDAGSYHDGWATYTIGVYADIVGYDGGLDVYSQTGFGSMGDNTYDDGGSTTRTITSCYWATINNAALGNLWLTLSGSSISDSNTTFIGITVNATYFARSARSNYYNNSPSGGSTWVWSPVSNPFGATSGTFNFTVDVV